MFQKIDLSFQKQFNFEMQEYHKQISQKHCLGRQSSSKHDVADQVQLLEDDWSHSVNK